MHFMTSMQYFPVRTLEPMHSWRSFTNAPETALCSLLKEETYIITWILLEYSKHVMHLPVNNLDSEDIERPD